MTRRERLERKLELRREWAGKQEAKAESKFTQAHNQIAGIPPGQPILVGHHSERRHRRDLEKHDNAMRAGVDAEKMAAHHESKAEGLEGQLAGSIYSDDPDAIEALQAKIAANEEKRDRMKLINKLYKKGDAAGLLAIGADYEQLKAACEKAGSYWGQAPHLPYEMTNIGATIRKDKERIIHIQNRQARAVSAEECGGVLIEGTDYVRVTFSEKPDREVLNALKTAGFHWSGGSWCGYRKNLPDGIERSA